MQLRQHIVNLEQLLHSTGLQPSAAVRPEIASTSCLQGLVKAVGVSNYGMFRGCL
jgi:hypothetical protein